MDRYPDTADFSFVHFTDTHIMTGVPDARSADIRQLDTEATLQRVIRAIKTLQPRPAFAVIGGDLASPDLLDRNRTLTVADYEPSYRLLQSTLRDLPLPIYMVLGNHDNRDAFHRVMNTQPPTPEAPYYYGFNYQGYHFIGLDSHQPGQHEGYLDQAQLAWLRGDLDMHREQPTLVFVHHHPWEVALRWLDVQRLRNGDELVHLLQQHGNVRWIICGHVHLDHQVQRHGLTQLTTPSTCFQVSQVSQERKILPGPPGFRLVHIRGQELSTRVIHLYSQHEESF